MDPFSFIVICVAVWAILQRTPGLIGEAVAEYKAGKDGGTTQAADDRRQRLLDAGIDPATGGPFRQFAGNVWRDYWVGKDKDRQDKKAKDGATTGRSWWRRKLDDAVEQCVDWWGTGDKPDPATQDDGGAADLPEGSSTFDDPMFDEPMPDSYDPRPLNPDGPQPPPHGYDGGPQPDPATSPDPGPGADSDSGPRDPWPDTDPWTGSPGGATPTSDGPGAPGSTGPQRPPIKVTATVGDPIHQTNGTATAVLDPPAQIEGNPMGTAVASNGVTITGMASGSYEMLSIDMQLESATAAYIAQLMAVQRRLNRAGESTVGVVQLSGGSTVMGRMAQAAEAVAAARAAVGACAGEVSPLLLATKVEFDKRKS